MSDICPHHLSVIGACHPALHLLLARDLGQRTLPPLTAPSLLGSVGNKPLCVNVLKLCLQSKRPWGFHLPRVGLGGSRGSYLLTPCGWVVPPHSAGHHLHILNTLALGFPTRSHTQRPTTQPDPQALWVSINWQTPAQRIEALRCAVLFNIDGIVSALFFVS